MCPNKATFPGNWEACAGSEHPAQHSLRMCCWERAAPLVSLAAKAALHAVDMLVVVCSLPDAQECCFSKSEGGEDASPLEGLRWEKLCKSSSFILGAACSVSVRWNQTELQFYHCQNWKKRLLISHPEGFSYILSGGMKKWQRSIMCISRISPLLFLILLHLAIKRFDEFYKWNI